MKPDKTALQKPLSHLERLEKYFDRQIKLSNKYGLFQSKNKQQENKES